jgi:hypothetical protein
VVGVEEAEDGVVVAVVVAGEVAVGEVALEGGEADVSVARQRLASTSEWEHTQVQVLLGRSIST